MAQQRSGPSVVAASYGMGLSVAGSVLRPVGFALSFWWHGVRGWCRMMAGREGEDMTVVLRRRKWLVLLMVSWPLVLVSWFSPFLIGHVGVLRTVGAFPLAIVSMTVSVLSIWRVRRLGKQGRAVQAVAPVQGPPSALDVGEWSDTNPRTQAAERAIGDLLWKLSENGMSTADALRVVASMPAFSQSVLLFCSESTLARFSEQGAEGKLVDDPGAVEVMVWFFDFTAKLRSWMVGNQSAPRSEPAMRRRGR